MCFVWTFLFMYFANAFCGMPHVRVRMTNRGVPAQLLERASIQVQKQQRSIRKVAKDMGIPVASLARYLKRK